VTLKQRLYPNAVNQLRRRLRIIEPYRSMKKTHSTREEVIIVPKEPLTKSLKKLKSGLIIVVEIDLFISSYSEGES
jgi:hypothetical protein